MKLQSRTSSLIVMLSQIWYKNHLAISTEYKFY